MSKKKPYKEPVFLFTSGSLRKAAWAGWHSALGEAKQTEEWIHMANSEWVKELGALRHFSFVDLYNHDIWKYVPPDKLEKILKEFWQTIKMEIRKGKKSTQKIP